MLEEDTSFVSKFTLVRELLTIDYFDSTKNELNFKLNGTYTVSYTHLTLPTNREV